MHGRYEGGQRFASRTYSDLPSHKAVRFRLRYWAVDSWDREHAYVKVDGQRKWELKDISRQSCDLWGDRDRTGKLRMRARLGSTEISTKT